MHILNAAGERVQLDLVEERPMADAIESGSLVASLGGLSVATLTSSFLLSRAETVHAFHATSSRAFASALRRRRPEKAREPVAVFREHRSGLVRTVKREVVIRFRPRTPARVRNQIFARHGVAPRRKSPDAPDQFVVADPSRKTAGVQLVDLANDMMELDEVVFATPNFISEYRRAAVATVPPQQWHLRNRGEAAGQVEGEDLGAMGAWRTTHGKRSIVVALLDDGVDVDHPELKSRVMRDPGRKGPAGRDFFLPDDDPDHYNPRPKQFRYPYWELDGNDIHGTACAGIVASAGKRAYGVAYGSRLLPVKVLHGNDYAPDERVAEAIRYSARHADVLSISWTGPSSVDIESALSPDAQRLGREGRGTPIACATGNDGLASVSRPAGMQGTIAVGASTDRGLHASYSNCGPEVDVVAPSSGGVEGIFTTDVSVPGRGFNSGSTGSKGDDALYTNTFGGTSAATPAVAGTIALMLSANPALDRESVRGILRETADRIGSGYDASGHSVQYGCGRVNAARAVETARALA